MAFPLKSGADLYNNQLIRAAIWNYSADIIEPSELVTGLIYFNTSNSSAGKKLRLYTGSAWKTLAFEEDLDVANNAEFKALEDKVKLLAGEVDTDAIINNMKDVENFLAGFNESGGTLMNYLNTELGKKLDLSGGTISASGYYGLKLKSIGQDAVALAFENKDSVSGYLMYAGGSNWKVTAANWAATYDLLHSGNIGEYAFIPRTEIFYNTNADNLIINGVYLNASGNGSGNINFPVAYGMLITFAQQEKYAAQISIGYDSMHVRRKIDTWSDWRTIAFTDSNVASATKLQTARTIWGQSFDGTGNVSGDLDLFQSGIYWHRDKANYCIETEIHDNASPSLKIAHYGGISFYTKGEQKMSINNSGNVLIGATEDNGDKLQVKGNTTFLGYTHIASGWSLFLAKDAEGIYFEGNGVYWHNAANAWVKTLMVFNGEGNVTINGNVGIGLANPEHKLHVGGDIVASGTIACKGIAAEGDAMDMVDKVVLHIVPNGNQQTFTLTHGLGTREITICIYEVTSLGTNMILTDVEIVNDNSISVSFGNPPTENHMVVVMG